MRWSAHRLTAFADFSEVEIARFESLSEPPSRFRKGDPIRRQGEPFDGIFLMIEGWVSSSIILPSGSRLIQKLHLPGDILGTPSMILTHFADTLTPVTDCVIAHIPDQRLKELFSKEPRLSSVFLMAAQAERLMLMDMLAMKGHSSAVQQFARFLLDIHARLSPLGLVDNDTFELPLTQEVIADILGITPVHTNRTIRTCEQQELIERADHKIRLLDMDALRSLSPLPNRSLSRNPRWLP